jgi:hypothetical protein
MTGLRIPTSAALDQLSSDSGLVSAPGPSPYGLWRLVESDERNHVWRFIVIDHHAKSAIKKRLLGLLGAETGAREGLARELDRLTHAPTMVAFGLDTATQLGGTTIDLAYDGTLRLLTAMTRVRAVGYQSIWSDEWVVADPTANQLLGCPLASRFSGSSM